MKELMGGLFGLVALLIGAINMRINSVIKRLERHEDNTFSAIAGDGEKRDRWWAALDSHKTEFHAFKDEVLKNYPTKEDLKAMEARLITAISGRK